MKKIRCNWKILLTALAFVLAATSSVLYYHYDYNNNNITSNKQEKNVVDKEEKKENTELSGDIYSRLEQLAKEGKAYKVTNTYSDYSNIEVTLIKKGEYAVLNKNSDTGYTDITLIEKIGSKDNRVNYTINSFGYFSVPKDEYVSANFSYLEKKDDKYVQRASTGYIINLNYLNRLGVSSVLELYEKYIGKTDYNGTGEYKIGSDLKAGDYNLSPIQSSNYGKYYISSDINNKEELSTDSRWIFSLKDGDYLTLKYSSYKKIESVSTSKDDSKPDKISNASQAMIKKINKLIADGKAFKGDSGMEEYLKIKKGEYVAVPYYLTSNELYLDPWGFNYYRIEFTQDLNYYTSNEERSYFDYITVEKDEIIKTDAVMIKVDALDELGVSGALELYKVLTNKKNYNTVGNYKVGTDISEGTYTLKCVPNGIDGGCTGYYNIASGPNASVNNNVVTEDYFNGSKTITVKSGQYLYVDYASITKK